MVNVWVFANFNDPKNLGLLAQARSLADSCGGSTTAVCADEEEKSDRLFAFGADSVIHLQVTGSEMLKAQALVELCQQYHPEVVLFPATIECSVIAARSAALLGTGLTADCTGLSIDENGLLRQTRPAYGGGLIAEIYCKERRPQLATVRIGLFRIPQPDQARTGNHFFFTPSTPQTDLVELIARSAVPKQKNLREAQIIIAGGKGVGSRAGFDKLRELAERMGGMVGATRSAIDAGYADFDCQVGQTGTSVSPQLYIAFGISGAPQHIAGMVTSGKVIAVNSDPKAPIFDYANLAIVGDWLEVAEELLRRLP